MKVLHIEDNSETAANVALIMQSESFDIRTADLGEEGIKLAKLYDYDIILLDLNLPDISGYDVLRTLRTSNIETPIMIVSGMAGIEDKVRGLGFGADDYMTKPFHKAELIARMHAIVRREKKQTQNIIHTGPLTVNLDTKAVTVNDKNVSLTSSQYKILELLSRHKGTIVTKEMFLNHLYGEAHRPASNTIDVFINKLRNKIQPFLQDDQENPLETLWGRGYALVDPKKETTEQFRAAIEQSVQTIPLPPTVTHEILEHGNFSYNKTMDTFFINGKNLNIPRVLVIYMKILIDHPGQEMSFKKFSQLRMQEDGHELSYSNLNMQIKSLDERLQSAGSDLRIYKIKEEWMLLPNDPIIKNVSPIPFPQMAIPEILSFETLNKTFNATFNGHHTQPTTNFGAQYTVNGEPQPLKLRIGG